MVKGKVQWNSSSNREDPKLKEILLFKTPTLHHLKTYPMLPVREATPWPSTRSTSENLFKARKDWLSSPLHLHLTVKTEAPPQVAAIPYAVVMPKEAVEKVLMGTALPHLQEWGGTWRGRLELCNRQKRTAKEWVPTKHSVPPVTKHSVQIQSFNVPDRYSEQIRLRREWEEKMECLNEKYNLDYYSSLEYDSNFELEHKYEMLIWTFLLIYWKESREPVSEWHLNFFHEHFSFNNMT